MNKETPGSKQYDVLVVGELNVDIILNGLHKFPEIGKEILADSMNITLGSSSAIFASNLSTLGSRTSFAGRLGMDDFGDYIVTDLKNKGVDTAHIIRSKTHQTGATIVLNVGEDRAMVTHPGAMTELSLHDITDEMMLRARHLHLSSIFLQPNIRKDIIALFKKAKEAGLTTSIDPQWDPEEKWNVDFKSLLNYVDIFLPNESELQAITKIQDIELASSVLPFAGILVVKKGNEGAYLWNQEGRLHQPAFVNKEVVDSIGAGDSFNAGFIHSYLQGKSLKKCLEFAALTGAVNTTRPGGTSAFQNLDTVKRIAQSTFNYTF